MKIRFQNKKFLKIKMINAIFRNKINSLKFLF